MTTSSDSGLDKRVNAIRPDLADSSLQVVVKADSYVAPQMRQCVRGSVSLLAAPHADAQRLSEIRYGEFLDVFEQRSDGFAWVQNRTDRYVGYIQSAHVLSEQVSALSNRVNRLCSFVYAKPDPKSALLDELTLGSFVEASEAENGFLKLATGGFLFAKHVVDTASALEPDYVFTAGRLLGTPYVWGGRTSRGLDCSALVQLSLDMAGIDCPRDSDLQCAAMGHPLPAHWRDVVWRRGDIVFFKDHVGLMTNGEQIIHASIFSMQVSVEPLADLVLRGKEIIAMGRP